MCREIAVSHCITDVLLGFILADSLLLTYIRKCMGGTFQARAGFQDSDIFKKAIKMALRCTFSVNSHITLTFVMQVLLT